MNKNKLLLYYHYFIYNNMFFFSGKMCVYAMCKLIVAFVL